MLRVLIVEDEAVIGLLLQEVIESLGHVVCAISNTEALAVAAAERCRPDLMIVDAGLRSGDGVSAVEAIERKKHVPHVFVTGNVRKVQARRPGAIILEKPFFTPDLVAAITCALAMEGERSL